MYIYLLSVYMCICWKTTLNIVTEEAFALSIVTNKYFELVDSCFLNVYNCSLISILVFL